MGQFRWQTCGYRTERTNPVRGRVPVQHPPRITHAIVLDRRPPPRSCMDGAGARLDSMCIRTTAIRGPFGRESGGWPAARTCTHNVSDALARCGQPTIMMHACIHCRPLATWLARCATDSLAKGADIDGNEFTARPCVFILFAHAGVPLPSPPPPPPPPSPPSPSPPHDLR